MEDSYSIIIRNATVITMDTQRRIVHDAVVCVRGERIEFVGSRREAENTLQDTTADKVIDAQGKVVLPGLIDTHAHGGHGLTKTLGEGSLPMGLEWDEFMERIYFQGTTPEFWRTEALLSGLEKLKFGVTTGMSMLGSYARDDDVEC